MKNLACPVRHTHAHTDTKRESIDLLFIHCISEPKMTDTNMQVNQECNKFM